MRHTGPQPRQMWLLNETEWTRPPEAYQGTEQEFWLGESGNSTQSICQWEWKANLWGNHFHFQLDSFRELFFRSPAFPARVFSFCFVVSVVFRGPNPPGSGTLHTFFKLGSQHWARSLPPRPPSLAVLWLLVFLSRCSSLLLSGWRGGVWGGDSQKSASASEFANRQS